MIPKEFYILPEELFRLGNSSDPKLSIVRANGKGISVFDKQGISESPMSGWAWRFPPNT